MVVEPRLGAFRIGRGFGRLSCEVAFESTADLFGGRCLGSPFRDVGPGLWVVDHAAEGDHVQGTILGAVPSAVEPVMYGIAR